jgi:hypothetical protein
VRIRYVEEIRPLDELGANDVVPEEFETAVEVFDRVLRKHLSSFICRDSSSASFASEKALR